MTKIKNLTPGQLKRIGRKMEEMRSAPNSQAIRINEKMFDFFNTLYIFGIITLEEYSELENARTVSFLRQSVKIGEILQSYGEVEDADT